MKAVIIHATGDADVLRLEEVERPEPGEDEVLIRVQAAAVNPVDWKYRRGLVQRELPAVLGEDVSGTVAVSRADGFAPGMKVFGVTTSGGYAEYATGSATAGVACSADTASGRPERRRRTARAIACPTASAAPSRATRIEEPNAGGDQASVSS